MSRSVSLPTPDDGLPGRLGTLVQEVSGVLKIGPERDGLI